ncbi:hypothetical protein [Klebsiella michiganensis]|uniref:hypothetical protein n=1 Tax=Klebsiella michiganensis TaxID=1134687 RepID=UPI001FD86C85|nr:hypothetical protein [Klebsiella michiganensis]
MTDITEQAQRNELLIANGQQIADLLRHLADNEIDSDYFAVVSECESYGQETDAELSITEFALRAAGYVDELVEALEKAQQVDEELCKLLPPGVEYMDPPDGGDVTPLEGVRRMVADYRQRIAELESRTVKLPAELYTIGELIRTQDNRITDQPMFVVFQKQEIIGSDEHSPSRICWVRDGEEVNPLRALRLEILYQDGRDTRGYDRYAMQEVDEFVTACFTEHGCKEYLRQNGHNLRLPYIYACGSFRNNEYQLVRNWLAGIKVEAE